MRASSSLILIEGRTRGRSLLKSFDAETEPEGAFKAELAFDCGCDE